MIKKGGFQETRPEVYSWPLNQKASNKKALSSLIIIKEGSTNKNFHRSLLVEIERFDAIAITPKRCIVGKKVRKQGPLKIEF